MKKNIFCRDCRLYSKMDELDDIGKCENVTSHVCFVTGDHEICNNFKPSKEKIEGNGPKVNVRALQQLAELFDD